MVATRSLNYAGYRFNDYKLPMLLEKRNVVGVQYSVSSGTVSGVFGVDGSPCLLSSQPGCCLGVFCQSLSQSQLGAAYSTGEVS